MIRTDSNGSHKRKKVLLLVHKRASTRGNLGRETIIPKFLICAGVLLSLVMGSGTDLTEDGGRNLA